LEFKLQLVRFDARTLNLNSNSVENHAFRVKFTRTRKPSSQEESPAVPKSTIPCIEMRDDQLGSHDAKEKLSVAED
jgi:hypothetical protein